MSPSLRLGSTTIQRFEPKIVGVIGGKNSESDLNTAIQKGAEVMEIRLDWWERDFGNSDTLMQDLKNIREKSPIPFICTLYGKNELVGGGFSGSDEEKFSILSKVTDYADAIDISYCTAPEMRGKLIEYVKKKGKSVILSHVLQAPKEKKEKGNSWLDSERLSRTMNEMVNIDADCYKVTAEAITTEDMVANMYALLDIVDNYPEKPVVSISTGLNGMASRVIFPLMGSYLTYGFLKDEPSEGKISIERLRETIDFLKEAIPLIDDIRKTKQVPPVILEAFQ